MNTYGTLYNTENIVDLMSRRNVKSLQHISEKYINHESNIKLRYEFRYETIIVKYKIN